ncbi:MAG: hypothetical protein JEZ01_03140 [Labilibaculum sp.]|nr:hypothetical protein [Labilibaculum sp.]MBI9056747.1 hypothetical protein [Labilibaculum sp.]
MIDYIKVQLQGVNISELKENKYLNFIGEFDEATGEILKGRAKYRGLLFQIFPSEYVLVQGSLHKYWNNGEHNYNDFNIVSILNVLKDIKDKFNITPHQMDLKGLELGVNITTTHDTKQILKSCFIHCSEPFKWCNVQNNGQYIQAKHSQYLIKIYNKAKQYRDKGYNIESEILRFEIKYRKMEKLKRLGIVNLQDLLDYKLENFVSVLVEEWQRILFYDFTIKSDSKLLLKYNNPIYWQELLERKTRSSFKKHKRQLSKLILQNSDNISEQISNLIEQKGNILSCRGIRIDRKLNQEKKEKYTPSFPILESIKIDKGIHIDPLVILSIQIPLEKENRICVVTGLSIHNQKEESKMLSHTGLYFYQKHYPKIFDMLKEKYLTDYWSEPDLKKQVFEIAHNIRNTKSNIEIKQKRIYPVDQYRLFDVG